MFYSFPPKPYISDFQSIITIIQISKITSIIIPSQAEKRSQNKIEVCIKNPYKRINHLPQFPLGWPSTQTQALPLQWWLKYPQKFHPPFLVLLQSHETHAEMGLWFMQGMQQPSLNLAHLAPLPKQPWQRSFPVLQSTRSQPRTGTVTWTTPPVHPSQQPPSTTAKGVYWTATLQRGRWRDLAEVMQTRGSCLSQVWSPSKGLQLLQENLPAQLLLQLGQMVAWKVSPFLMGLRLNQFTFEIPPQSTACTEAVSSSTVSANPMAFINLSTNYYSKQKITADQYFPNHSQKNTRNRNRDLPAFFAREKFFQKTFWLKIPKEIGCNKRRNLGRQACDWVVKRLQIKLYQAIFMEI